MNKKLIVILGTVMALVLLSLITVQINWIRNAYIVKEQQFDQMVHQAMTDIVNVISRQEDYMLLRDEFSLNQSNKTRAAQNQSRPKVNSQNQPSDTISSNFPPINKLNVPNPSAQDRQHYINQLLMRMFSNKPNIEERISEAEIEAIVSETLLDYGIDIGFEYAVHKERNTIVYISKDYSPDEISSVYRVRLYPNDYQPQANYLDLYFPQKRNFIFRSLAFIGISSGVLTLLIVFTFAFTLYVIFRQKRVSEVKNDFVNNMTHELKTPISTISLASQMLGDKSIPDEAKNLTRISKIISQESKRLGYQVEKVLQIAAIDKGDFQLNLRKVDVHELIENVASNFTIQVDSKGGLLIPSLHATKTEIMADTVHMTNVISNLLDNAVKYTPENPEIYIETRNIGDKLMVSVRDNGIGISKTNQKKIFDRFFRVPTGNVHNVKGFGLGLNYVKKVVEMHNGTIDVTSETDVGTTFSFTIPIKQ